ncbi:PAS domain S-box protein, partial [bacterium]|nr:PAS domain S-box protein [bacterium]
MKKQKFSHEKLSQNYFDIAEVILVVLDEAGVIESINRKGCAVLGVSADEIVGKNWFDLCIPKENLQAVKSAFAQLISGDLEPVAYYENPVVTSEGSLRLIAWHNSYLTDDQGRIVGILSSGEDITEKNLADERLKKSEERFRYLAEKSTDFIWEVDAQMILTYVSPNIYDVLGCRADEVVGKSAFGLMPEKDRQAVADEFFPLMEKRSTFANLENTNRHKSGHLVTFESSGIPVFNSDGLFVGYRGIERNITLRRLAEKEREQQMEVLHLASRVGSVLAKLNRLDDMLRECCELVVSHNKAAFCRIWLIPENGQILELVASAGIYTRLDGGFSRKAVDNTSKIGMIALTNRPYIVNDLLGDPLVVEKNWVKTEQLQSFAGYPLFVNNRVVGVIAFFSQNALAESVLTSFMAITDEIAITIEKKRVEERLLHVASALENVAEEVVITDLDGKIFYVNPACEKITGYNRTELIGNNPRIFQSGQQDETFYEDLWNTITSGDIWTNRIINKTKDGRLILEDATISSVIDPTGKHLGYVSVKRDVTEQVRLEENLQQSQKMEAIGAL